MRGHARPFRLLVPTTMLAVVALSACSGAPAPGSQPAATQGPTQSATVASDAVATPATTAAATSSVAAPHGTASPTPSPVAQPTATAPGPSGGTADIYGTISYRDELETHSGPNEPQSDTHHLVVDTINVLLSRNPNGTGEYVDAGSTYSTKSSG